MRLGLLTFLAAVVPFTVADVQFVTPAGASAGASLTVTWKDSVTPPALGDLSGYQIFLMVGGNNDATSQQVLTTPASITNSHKSGTSATFSIPATAGPPDPNAYFLKIISAPNSGTGNVINYSQRFTVAGMTGAWPSPAIQTAYKQVSSDITAVPPTANTVANNNNNNAQPGAGAPADNGQFGISYQFQTVGNTKYAPMQPIPGTKITAQNTVPLYPPSPFVVATTFLPIPTIVTTITQAFTHKVSSRENTATPAAMPMDAVQKYLARWRD